MVTPVSVLTIALAAARRREVHAAEHISLVATCKAAPVAALGGLYDRLVSRLGANVVVRPCRTPSYISERAVRFALRRRNKAVMMSLLLPWPAARPLFLLCAPELIEVIAEIPGGAPYRLRWQRVFLSHRSLGGNIAPEWWTTS